MPRTFSFIAALAAALAVAVPTAAAEGQPTGTVGAEAANATAEMLDARERALGAKSDAVLVSDLHADEFAQAVSPQARPEPVRDDRFRIGSASDPVLVAPAPSDGMDLEWPQIGIGALLLIALGICTYLVARSRQRPLAH
jgi:hypothetical protein